jgi:polyphosphate kinase 2 (PPK2 family)
MVLFDRSWYNRAGVERVMGFCTDAEYEEFFHSAPEFERLLVRSGIVLLNYWFSITRGAAFSLPDAHSRPAQAVEALPMDLESRTRWEQYTKGKEAMLERTHIREEPWWIVEAVDKKRARLNCITHLLKQIPPGDVPHPEIVLPERVHHPDYLGGPIPREMYLPAIY